MRLVHLERLQLVELTETRRGLVETVSALRSFHGHAEPGRARRLLREQLRSSSDVVGAMQVAVRADELLDEGFVAVPSDQHLLSLVSHLSPWSDWLAARTEVSRLEALWSSWAPPGLLREVLTEVQQVHPTLTLLFVRTPRFTFECTLPLAPDELTDAPEALHPFLLTHARMRGLLMYGGGSNMPPRLLEVGWSASGYQVTRSAEVAHAMLRVLSRRY